MVVFNFYIRNKTDVSCLNRYFCTLSVYINIFFISEKFGYIIYRLLTFLDPSSGDNFQNEKALEAIKLGGLKGQGMGEGILKDNVPEAHTDYIIAIISEEFGSILSIMIVLIFLYISYRVIKICIKEENEFIRLSLSGLSSLLIFQTFIHIGVNTSLLPTTGMTLPFLSYGGSSLIGSAILAGMILNFTKKGFKMKNKKKNFNRSRRHWWTCLSSLQLM